jgi:peptidoglycan hydrolase-like protein with peptidoglycan-binding domain
VAAADPELAAFIGTCLDKDPERRPLPETVFRTSIGHQLSTPTGSPHRLAPKRALSRGGGLSADQVSRDLPAPPPPARPADSAAVDAPMAPASRKRKRLVVGAAATAAVLVAGGVTVALLQQGDDIKAAAPGSGSGVSPLQTSNPAPTPSSSKQATRPTNSKTDQAAEKPPSSSPTEAPAKLDIRTTACPAQLASGAHGDCVKALQTLLAGYGLYVTVDGSFGAETVAAVRAFQTEVGITADGKAGAKTKDLLYGQPRGPVRTGSLTVVESVNGASVDRCLQGGVGSAGLDVQVWGCKGTAAQKWALYRVPGQNSRYLVVNQGNHRCLNADTGSTGGAQKVRTRTCDGLTAQKWQLGDTGPSGGRTLVSVPGGFCVDAEAADSGRDGQQVQWWGCAGSTNQVWKWS